MNVLDHQLRLADELAARSREGESYRSALEEIIGFPTDGALISTSEHVAPFNIAHTVSYVLPQFALQAAGLRPPSTVVILAGSLIPLDNSHYPRGFFLPEGAQWNHRFNLHPQWMNKMAPLFLPPANGTTRSKAEKFFNKYPWLKEVLNETDKFETYADQLAACMEVVSNQWLDGVSSRLRVRPLESVARQMLLRLIEAGDPLVNPLLFDSRMRGEVGRLLHGVFCAWGERQGSFLFWGNMDSRPVRLREEDGHLVGEGVRVAIEKNSIADALRDGLLWPGVFLSLLMVSYLPNLPISGGPKQLQYYRSMVQAANAVFGEIRQTGLSLLGYMNMDMCSLSLRRGENLPFPDFGTGLALSRTRVELDFIIEQLRETEFVPKTDVKYHYE